MFKENFEPTKEIDKSENFTDKKVSRRNFLKAAAVAAGVIAVGGLVESRPASAGEAKEKEMPTERQKFAENIRVCFYNKTGYDVLDFGKEGAGVLLDERVGLGKVSEQNISKFNKVMDSHIKFMKKIPEATKQEFFKVAREISVKEAEKNGNETGKIVKKIVENGKTKYYTIDKDKMAGLIKIADYVKDVQNLAEENVLHTLGQEFFIEKESSLQEIKEDLDEKLSKDIVRLKSKGDGSRYARKRVPEKNKDAKYFIFRPLTAKEKSAENR